MEQKKCEVCTIIELLKATIDTKDKTIRMKDKKIQLLTQQIQIVKVNSVKIDLASN